MHGYGAQFVLGFFQEFGRFPGNEFVGSAVEAIAAHMQFGIHGVWQRVDIGFRRQAGHAEFRIETRHIGHTGEELFADFNAHEIGGIMQGAKQEVILDDLPDALIHEDGLRDFLAPVQHAMAYAVDFLLVLDHADLRINQQRNDQFHGLDMGWEILVAHNFLLLVGIGHDLVRQLALFQANAFGKAGAENCFVAHVDELIFAGGRAGIDYKYLHDIPFLYCFLFRFFVGRGLDGRNGDSVDDIGNKTAA